MIETNATRARYDNKKLFHLRLHVLLLFLLLLCTTTPPSCLSAAATPSSFALYLLPGKKNNCRVGIEFLPDIWATLWAWNGL